MKTPNRLSLKGRRLYGLTAVAVLHSPRPEYRIEEAVLALTSRASFRARCVTPSRAQRQLRISITARARGKVGQHSQVVISSPRQVLLIPTEKGDVTASLFVYQSGAEGPARGLGAAGYSLDHRWRRSRTVPPARRPSPAIPGPGNRLPESASYAYV